MTSDVPHAELEQLSTDLGRSQPVAGGDVCSASALRSLCLRSAPASAQSVQRFALDSVASIDVFGGENVSNHPQIIIDVSGGVRISDHRAGVHPPVVSSPSAEHADRAGADLEPRALSGRHPVRTAGNGAGLATRVDVGYNVSPIGLGIIDTRPSLNPMIAPHVSYLIPMPAFDLTVPRVSAIASTYPLGGQVTVSSAHWDARGARAQLRADPQSTPSAGRPVRRQTPVFVAGAGVTPFTGLRLGVSFAQGDYATADEVTGPAPSGRSVAIVGGEGEYAFGYTKISGEFVRSQLRARPRARAVAYECFVQGIQTLSPRWFVAGRHESTLAPPLITATPSASARASA